LLDEPEGSSAPLGDSQAGLLPFCDKICDKPFSEIACRRKSFYIKYTRQESNTSTPPDQDNPLCRQEVASNFEACSGISATASAAKSGADLTCPDLQRLVETWPGLSAVARAAIIAVLDATK
jgi:hypothetical protein